MGETMIFCWLVFLTAAIVDPLHSAKLLDRTAIFWRGAELVVLLHRLNWGAPPSIYNINYLLNSKWEQTND